jgi:hypothetical protein
MTTYLLKNGNKFIGYDSMSGGYPWESSSIENAHKLDDPVALMKWIGNEYPSAKLMKLEYVLTEVSKPDIEAEKKAAALAKLTAEERKILGL